MPDRVIRDEILESDRWLDLPTDAARLAFVGFVLICDDFGNLEGGQRRLFRFLHKFTQVKTQDAATAVIDALMQSDLLRRYTDNDRELFHIPRFKSHRQYLSRQFPPSPWCPSETELGKHKRIINKGLATNVVTTSLQRSNDVAEGVGVGVGELPSAKPRPDPLNAATWLAYSEAYLARYREPPVRNAKVNSNIASLVKRLGMEAPDVAAFYLTHNESFYIKKRHMTGPLLSDAEGLRTQWKTGTKATALEARSAEQKDSLREQYKRLTGENP